jgi:hypothetical protein
VNPFGPSAQTFASISAVGKDIKLMLPSSLASRMKYLECQNALFYNKMWDHAQVFILNNYHYTVQLTLDSEHVTHDTLTAGRLSVVLSLHLLTVLLVCISSTYSVVTINIKH